MKIGYTRLKFTEDCTYYKYDNGKTIQYWREAKFGDNGAYEYFNTFWGDWMSGKIVPELVRMSYDELLIMSIK